jgi:hypothetical protein
MVVGLDGEGFEPALPDVSTGMIVAEIASHMGGEEPVHPAAEVAIVTWPERHVKVIGHEAVSDDPHGDATRGLDHHLKEGVVVAVFVEDGGSRIAAVQDMIAVPGSGGSSGAGHGKNLFRIANMA